MIGLCQAVSAAFILWAILKLYRASGRNLTLRELVNQKFITLHIITLIVYLASCIVYYVYFALWDKADEQAENRVFISWTISGILLTVVKLVLLYLFIKLSKPPHEKDGVEGEHIVLMPDDVSPKNEPMRSKPESFVRTNSWSNSADDLEPEDQHRQSSGAMQYAKVVD